MSGETHSRLSQPLWRDPAEFLAGGLPEVVHTHGGPPLQALDDASLFGRREFLEMLAAAVAIASQSGCSSSQPAESIVPYAKSPEQIIPGNPLFFASSMTVNGRSLGLLVESHTGRPTKIEGNPLHPASLGATDAIAQAAVMSLYDPDRSQSIRHLGEISTWERYLVDLKDALDGQRASQGRGLRILTETVVSPTLGRQLKSLLEQFPQARWHQYDAVNSDQAGLADQRLFQKRYDRRYHFARADVVVSLDADLISGLNGSVRYARDLMSRRDFTTSTLAMNRLYVAESSVSCTGSVADHRLPIRPSRILSLVQAIAGRLDIIPVVDQPRDATTDWLDAVIQDLQTHRGSSLVIAGDRQPWQVHALVQLINQSLGNVGTTMELMPPVAVQPESHLDSLRALTSDMQSGRVEVLLIVEGNPVYTAPADLEFARHLAGIRRLAAHLSLYDDETSAFCHWQIPQSHFLESWSDARAFDGSASIAQPLIAPLYGGKSVHEFLSAAIDKTVLSAHDAVKATWSSQFEENDFEASWRKAVHDGVIDGTAFETVQARAEASSELLEDLATGPPPVSEQLEIVFAPDPCIGDGRFCNNGWLQELPRPWTHLTWENAALLAPATAERLSVEEGDWVDLSLGERTVRAPVWIVPGHPLDTVTVHLGYGRTAGGQLALNRGFDAYRLRTSASPEFSTGLQIQPAGGRTQLACTQKHFRLEGRDHDIARTTTAAELETNSPTAESHTHELPTLLPDYEYDRAWGMVIDLTRCTGCNACVIACQAENNVPVVGKPAVLMGREMHWLRIDRYYSGDLENPGVIQQPMLCQHCEHAPCEIVCPVAATTHSSEGLNEMTYNRCVGTRYCSNNCPYKVRRFNFLRYTRDDVPLESLRMNPDVTVRTRGVMEKCTYCVQRINAARIEASKTAALTGQPLIIDDGAIVTACQAACPSQAIVFGNINDAQSRIAGWRKQPHHFAVLEELGTRPRTTYLAQVRNPSPAIMAGDSNAADPTTQEGPA